MKLLPRSDTTRWLLTIALLLGASAAIADKPRALFIPETTADDVPIATELGLLHPSGQKLYVPSGEGIDVLDIPTGQRRLATKDANLPIALVGDGLLALRATPMEMIAWQGEATLVYVAPDGAVRVGGTIPSFGGYTTLSELAVRDGRLHAIATGKTPSGIYRHPEIPTPIEIELRSFELRRHSTTPYRTPTFYRHQLTHWGAFHIGWRSAPGLRFDLIVKRRVGSAPAETVVLPATRGPSIIDVNATAITLGTRDTWQVLDPRTLELRYESKRVDPERNHPMHVIRTAGLLLVLVENEVGPLTIVALDEKTGTERWRYEVTRRARSVQWEMMIRP